jgi:hypothetical protein
MVRLPGDVLFIAGVVPLVYLTARAILRPSQAPASEAGPGGLASPLFTEVAPGPAPD